jgi:thiol:disulfide interchange protein DsbD
MIKRAGLALLLLTAAMSWLAPAQTQEKIVTVKVASPANTFKPGGTYPLALEITVSTRYHINAEVPSEDYLIGTAVTFAPKAGVTYSKPIFPQAETKRLSFSQNPLAVYAGTVKVSVDVTLDKSFKGREVTIEGIVSYQACNDQSCLPPEEAGFSRIFPVASGEPEKKPGPGISEKAKSRPNAIGPVESTEPYVAVAPEPAARKEEPEKWAPAQREAAKPEGPKKPASLFEGKGLPFIFVLVFLGGLGLNLTPCVYPLIPITISYFGGQAEGKRGGIAVHAILYVVGMAITYSILGVIAAFAGSLFGAALQYPPVLVFIALVMIILALSMFDVYELRLPAFLNRLAGSQQKGYFGTLIMGLTVGIVAAPCIGPFILGLLTYVGDRGSVVLGFSLFFVLALGLGLPFLFLGIFSGSLSRLPRSGVWMVWVRKIFGFILIAMAVYFLKPLFPNSLFYSLSLALTLFVAGLYLAWLEPSLAPGKTFRYIKTWVGIIFLGAALVVAVTGIKDYLDAAIAKRIEGLGAAHPGSAAGSIAWVSYFEERKAEAGRAGKPVFIDSFADWCIPCRELDSRTFNQPEVVAASRDFVMLKADLTRRTDPVIAFYRKYGVRGVPTLIFLKPDGTEITELRGAGFESKEVFLEKMRRALELARKE